MKNRDHDDYPLDNKNAEETVERAYRRGVHQALSFAADHPRLLSEEALEIVFDMRHEIEKDYPCFLHRVLKQLTPPGERTALWSGTS